MLLSPANSTFARAAWMRALTRTAALETQVTGTFPELIDELALRFADAPALVGVDSTFTYRQLAARCQRYARWGLDAGLCSGDVVALFMGNCPDYLAVWLGLTRIGVSVALINAQLRGDWLLQALARLEIRAVVVGADLEPAFAAVAGRLPGVVWGTPSMLFERASATHITLAERTPPPLDATALYIFTSGTTGVPKAARVSHYRLLRWAHWFAGLLDTAPADRMYNCLPLYHSVGGVVACGATLLGGGAVIIRPRFSVSEFWRDLGDERCTLFQYIGELCRYLVNAPSQPEETRHRLRLICGNGLRKDVWERFQTRFRVPRILEYYASTEGNVSLYNCEGEPGAVGRVPPLFAARLPVALLRLDAERSTPLRAADGWCERCAVGETGEAIGPIPADAQRLGRFEGYADPAASAQKVLRDVFEAGDAWYRTGDLLRRDARGFYYFVERLGDAYRWKGENVSAADVLEVVSGCPGVLDALVYGVSVPGAEGRAGMAALVVTQPFDLAAFRSAVTMRLPRFARPVFLRVLPALIATETFKPTRQPLLTAGFDPTLTRDPLYVDDALAQAYVPLDAARFAEIQAGTFRL